MNFYVLNDDDTTRDYIHKIYLAGVSGKISLENIYLASLDADVKSDNVVLRAEDGIDFMAGIISGSTEEDLNTDDKLIPSHEAPHVLAQVMMRLLETEGYKSKLIAFPEKIGTPYESKLKKGLAAISFADDLCPLECTEEGLCFLNGVEIMWNIKDELATYANDYAEEVELISFRCSHYLNMVSIIEMKEIISGWLKINSIISKKENAKFLIATHSRCHGIAAFIEVKKK